MKFNDIVNNYHKFFIYSLLAWDDSDEKVEDMDENQMYFPDQKFKDYSKKLLNKYRKNVVKPIKYINNPETSTEFHVYETRKEVIIAFRGSDSKVDWAADFDCFKLTDNIINFVSSGREDYVPKIDINFMKEKYEKSKDKFNLDDYNIKNTTTFAAYKVSKDKNIFFHRGFMTQFKSVYKLFMNEFLKAYDSGKKVYIVGHSLGAGIAEVAYYTIMLQGYVNNVECYIYGTPKVTCKSFIDIFFNCTFYDKFHICNTEGDLVSKLPPESLGFYHPAIHKLTLKDMECGFNSKFNHTLFYYLFLFKNKTKMSYVDGE